ncbi:hypothetical protein CTAYLR_008938 [Chrysophaeum taylorii]|uniref:Elongation factor P C-terminal domain-containing protein n=1 Tax=Chrysophaeum taylorii TaxID=2483200 RepID=A0AAD7UK34_9STRA|nr:hypothetical protein CTAYLR_008938 [Chrysophaeum taylorii]
MAVVEPGNFKNGLTIEYQGQRCGKIIGFSTDEVGATSGDGDLETADHSSKDGMTVQIVSWGTTVVDVILPSSGTVRIGSTSVTSKSATLDTGAEIMVPLFVEIGDRVEVNCGERTFMERVKKN